MLRIFVFLILGCSAARAEVCGQLAGVKGSAVEILRMQPGRGGDRVRFAMRIEVGKTTPVECDDVVLAGRDSSAKLILANGKLTLGPESRIEVAAHSGGGKTPAKVNLINLTYGKMRAFIQKKKDEAKTDPQATFRVRTFSAVAGVRGTDFFASYDPNAGVMEQATLEGAVEVVQTATAQKVLVGAGKQVSVDSEKPSPKASPKPLQIKPIDEATKNDIRLASAVVSDDQDFTHANAVETLGKPETWTLEREALPSKYDRIKNEF